MCRIFVDLALGNGVYPEIFCDLLHIWYRGVLHFCWGRPTGYVYLICVCQRPVENRLLCFWEFPLFLLLSIYDLWIMEILYFDVSDLVQRIYYFVVTNCRNQIDCLCGTWSRDVCELICRAPLLCSEFFH